MKCRFCRFDVSIEFLDLGTHPPSNSYVLAENLSEPEPSYPLKVMVCGNCWLVQTQDFVKSESLFDRNYAYFSGASLSWNAHVQKFADTAIEDFDLDRESFVVEVASNDGALLKNFVARGIPNVGIEPTASTAAAARRLGVETIEKFFGSELASEMKSEGLEADLLVGNNVLAHVPDILDFAVGVELLLKDDGVASFEFPHLVNLLRYNQFDTVYHEHFSYLSLKAAKAVFEAARLKVWRVEELSTHGGSLRVFLCKQGSLRSVEDSVAEIIQDEDLFGISDPGTYRLLQSRAEKVASDFKDFVLDEVGAGRRVAGLGAAAKGNTLINFAGVTNEEILTVFDSAPAKHGLLTPGARIPIRPLADIVDFAPDTVVIFPWNIQDELEAELSNLGLDNLRVCTAVPELRVKG
jgi:hypothetical protein